MRSSKNNIYIYNCRPAERHGCSQSEVIPPCLADSTYRRQGPLTRAQWLGWQDSDGAVTNVEAFREAVFNGGVAPDIRRDVWKYMLKHRCVPYFRPHLHLYKLH